jgi:hypothetical protein
MLAHERQKSRVHPRFPQTLMNINPMAATMCINRGVHGQRRRTDCGGIPGGVEAG